MGNFLSLRRAYDTDRQLKQDVDLSTQGRSMTARLSGRNAYYNAKLNTLLNKTKSDLISTVRKFMDLETDRKETSKAMRRILTTAHKTAYLYGMKAGGYDGKDVPSPDKQWEERNRRAQYKFLYPFLDDIAAGRGKINYLDRAAMYTQDIHGAFNAGKISTVPNNLAVYWALNKSKSPITGLPVDHCDTCLFMSDRNPWTVDTIPIVPRGNHTLCLVNCQCRINLRKVTDKTLEKIRSKQGRPARTLAEMRKQGILR